MPTVLVYVSPSGKVSCRVDSPDVLTLVLDARESEVLPDVPLECAEDVFSASNLAAGLPKVDAAEVREVVADLAEALPQVTQQPGLLLLHRSQLWQLAKVLSSQVAESATPAEDAT